VEGSWGCEFAPSLPIVPGAHFIDKGVSADDECYSSFGGTGLVDWLHERRIRRLAICGLATDYCVLQTTLDACKEGFDVWLMTDAVAAVNASPGDEERALLAMRAAGARLSDSGQTTTILRHHPSPTAVIVVDVQNDFLPGGALPVAEGPRIFEPIEHLLRCSPAFVRRTS
jgi:nicotinamidase-related amidase